MTTKRDPQWDKNSHSASQGSCVKVAEGETVLVRDTQNRALGHIDYTSDGPCSSVM
ncbi:DUF397 domain-containing protein [Nocardiopsis sp. LOL_012]|uniref:DUF397 domain-containing protein n=1 Tax=Nocardiopsis sp. LOL_012 TaxID=3345409 RepID=UPI003A8A017B